MSHGFDLLAAEGRARLGRLATPHGEIETPAFIPVGSLGAVKGRSPQQLEETGASIMLANLYHLALRPGVKLIAEQGGLHAFCGWPGPILTDSGGFQVLSLAGLRTVDREGVRLQARREWLVTNLNAEHNPKENPPEATKEKLEKATSDQNTAGEQVDRHRNRGLRCIYGAVGFFVAGALSLLVVMVV